MAKEKDKKANVTKKADIKKAKEKNKQTKPSKEKKEGYLKQVVKEMKQVHFPNRKEMVKYSIATIFFVIFFGVYFYLIDLVMALVKSLV